MLLVVVIKLGPTAELATDVPNVQATENRNLSRGKNSQDLPEFLLQTRARMEGERFIISDKWEGTESVVEGFLPKILTYLGGVPGAT